MAATRRDLRLPAHWLPANVRSQRSVRPLLAPDPRWFLSDSQKRQIGVMRVLLSPLPWLLTFAAVLMLAPTNSRRSHHHG